MLFQKGSANTLGIFVVVLMVSAVFVATNVVRNTKEPLSLFGKAAIVAPDPIYTAPPTQSPTYTCYQCHPGASFCESYTSSSPCTTNCNSCSGSSPTSPTDPPPPPPPTTYCSYSGEYRCVDANTSAYCYNIYSPMAQNYCTYGCNSLNGQCKSAPTPSPTPRLTPTPTPTTYCSYSGEYKCSGSNVSEYCINPYVPTAKTTCTYGCDTITGRCKSAPQTPTPTPKPSASPAPTCRTLKQSCSTTSVCCSGLSCSSSVCLKANGAFCIDRTECASGICDLATDRCIAPLPTRSPSPQPTPSPLACISSGGVCTSSSSCCTGNSCSGGKCLKNNGLSCGAASECLSKYCNLSTRRCENPPVKCSFTGLWKCNGVYSEYCVSSGLDPITVNCGTVGCNSTTGQCNPKYCDQMGVYKCNGNVSELCTHPSQPLQKTTCTAGCNATTGQCNPNPITMSSLNQCMSQYHGCMVQNNSLCIPHEGVYNGKYCCFGTFQTNMCQTYQPATYDTAIQIYQTDPRWAGDTLPKGCTYKQAGCGVVSATMARFYFEGVPSNPEGFMKNFAGEYYQTGCNGTTMTNHEETFQDLGYQTSWIVSVNSNNPFDSKDQQEMRNFLYNGYVLLVAGNFEGYNHQVLITGIDSSGNFVIHDPYNRSYTTDFTISNVLAVKKQ